MSAAVDRPEPGEPQVEWLEKHTLSRWTFSTDDREAQEQEYRYWLGYFGDEEGTEPERIEGRVWYVRKQ